MRKTTKIFLVVFINIAIIFILLEVVAPLVYSLVTKERFDKHIIKENMRKYSLSRKEADFNTNEYFKGVDVPANLEGLNVMALHPYLGFVRDTKSDFANHYGFVNDKHILDNSAGKVKVVISGGSLALGLYLYARDIIAERIKSSGLYGDKEIEVFSVAIGGYKQPQQLMALNYFLSLGGSFDIWINLDGFNEITLPISNNWKSKVVPFYPRYWNLYANQFIEKRVLDHLVDITAIRNSRERLTAFFSRKILSSSSFSLLVWQVLDQRLGIQEYNLHQKLPDILYDRQLTYQASGPVDVDKKFEDVVTESAEIWRRTSDLMAKICKSKGIKYFHFLQPNQYVKGSKTFSKEEQVNAYVKGPFGYKILVLAGYPILIQEGEKLKQAGVSFHNLTMMFKDEIRSVYNDKCCHVNKLGYNQLANKISDTVILSEVSN